MALENVNADFMKVIEIAHLSDIAWRKMAYNPEISKQVYNKFRSEIFRILLEDRDEINRTQLK